MAQKLTINIIGSSGTPYTLNIATAGEDLHIYCTCPAGENGKFCKHVGQILDGDFSSVCDPSDKSLVGDFIGSPQAKSTLQNYAALRSALETQLKAEALAKKAAAKIKKEMFGLISPRNSE